MKSSAIRQLPYSFARGFGFLAGALMLLSTAECRFNKAKAASDDDDLRLKCPPGYEACIGLGPGDLAFWTHFCFDVPVSCRTNGEPPALRSNPDNHTPLPPTQKPAPRRRFAVRGR